MHSITLFSPAKLNLRLEILHKRTDGYHEIQTIFQKISLFDTLTFTALPAQGIALSVDSQSVPSDHTNLVYKAAAALIENQNLSVGISIKLEKRIPAGAGLGGGSSNAAATLIGLSRLFKLNLPPEELQRLAVSLGADVPFFVSAWNTACATGIGDVLHPVQLASRIWFLIVFPDFSIPTAWAYSLFSKYNILTKSKKNINVVNSVLSFDAVTTMLVNDFERVLIHEHPAISDIKHCLQQSGATGTLLSGSGSSVFGIFPTQEDTEKALSLLTVQQGYKVFVAHSL